MPDDDVISHTANRPDRQTDLPTYLSDTYRSTAAVTDQTDLPLDCGDDKDICTHMLEYLALMTTKTKVDCIRLPKYFVACYQWFAVDHNPVKPRDKLVPCYY